MESAGIDVADDSPCPARTAVLASGGAGGECEHGPEDNDLRPTRAAWLACAERWSVVVMSRTIACAPARTAVLASAADGEWNGPRGR
jgi:hypothetical protein